jgi:type IV pilus assembly protein PilA
MRATERDTGFTLVELLVVVLIIGILGAIAIPIFLGQQSRAKDALAISDLGQARSALIGYSMGKDGVYTTNLNELTDYGYALSTGVDETEITIAIDGISFCIEATSPTGKVFSVTEKSPVHDGECAA